MGRATWPIFRATMPLPVPIMKRAWRIRREIGDRKGIANSLNSLGNVAYYQGDYASARCLS